jgi:branched-chain amino acid transport system substrate-binding protein
MKKASHRKGLPSTGPTRREFMKVAVGGAALVAAGMPRFGRAQGADPIRIGLIVPLTGPYGAEAQDQVRGAELAIKQFNDAGGSKGRKAELLVRDDKMNPAEGATRAIELIEKDKAAFIVAPLSAAVQLAINNVTKQRGIIFNSISVSDAINEAKDWSKYTFHEALPSFAIAGAVARHAIPKLGKKVVFLTADYAYGHEMVRGFQAVGTPLGMEVLSEIRHPLGQTDYSSYIPRIQALKPDILCISSFGQDQLNAFKQITDFGLKAQMKVVAPQLVFTRRIAGGPEPYKGIIGATSYYWSLEDSIPSAKSFNEAFQAMHKRLPSDYGAVAYSGVRGLLTASSNAGSTESDKVVDALAALKYDFNRGPQYFRACDHQSVQSVMIIESKDKGDMKNEFDVFRIVSTEPADEARLRTCEALGHKA